VNRVRHSRVSTYNAGDWIVCLQDRWFNILPWRERQYVPPKRWYLSITRCHSL